MDMNDMLHAIFNYGGTIIMALLFVWVFIQDKTKNSQLIEENSKMIESLVESNKNIAKSLDIISNNLVTIDSKIDRNYEIELKGGSKNGIKY